jgi:glycosyltransferase involved in cell wall biosynthesis
LANQTPKLSVIVPVHQGASLLPLTLPAILQSQLPRAEWELVVVDDASTDNTPAIAAKWADRIVTLQGLPHGPALARNRGVEASNGKWIMFVDADVRIHPGTLSRVATTFESDPSIDAMFGAYDDAPEAPGFLSQYRNLLHRYVHLQGRGEADTFWAGCGAVTRRAFEAVGGFDAERFPRPQIEDIELGYRLRDGGHRIVLIPEIQGTHLKKWSFTSSVRTDVLDRGVPWVLLLLERRKLHKSANLNLKKGERWKTVIVTAGLIAIAAGAAYGSAPILTAGLVALTGVVFSNRALLAWFAHERGLWFAIRVAPMNLLYYVLGGISVTLALAKHVTRPR